MANIEGYRPEGLNMNEINKRAGELTVLPTIATSLENAAFDASYIRQEKLRSMREALKNPEVAQVWDAVMIAKAFHEARINNHQEGAQPAPSPSKTRRLFERVAAPAVALSLAACSVVGAEPVNQASPLTPEAIVQSVDMTNMTPASAPPVVDTPQFSHQLATAANVNPVGYLDGGYDAWWNVVLDGWAADGDAPTASLPVHVYRDGQFMTEWGAVEPSPDVAAAAPQFPGNHRFHVVLPQGPTDLIDHEFCVYAINVGGGDANPLLGCTIVGNPDPTNIERLAQDRSWLELSDAEKAARVEREYVQIRHAIAIELAGEGTAPNGDTNAHVMAEIPWWESRFGTHENTYNGRSGFIGLWQIAEVNSRDPLLANPYYSLKVSKDILERQGLGAWPNTSRYAMDGLSDHLFLDGTRAPNLDKYGI